MRTLPAGLAAGLKTNPPYVTLVGNDDTPADQGEADVVEYSLTQHTLTVKIVNGTSALDDLYQCRLRRGAIIAGAPTYVETSKLWPRSVVQHETFTEVVASVFPPSYYTAAGDGTYEAVLTAFATAIGFTAEFSNPTAGFWDYQFLPTGRSLVMNDTKHLLSLLKAKFLIEAADRGGQVLRFFCIPDTLAEAAQTMSDARIVESATAPFRVRRFIWRDELGTLHDSGLATSTIHNLGFIASTAGPPTDIANAGAAATVSIRQHLVVEPINLTIETGDRFAFNPTFNSFRARTVESFKTQSGRPPVWQTLLYNNEWFSSTEAGALPGTIEQAAPYTPLNVSQFDGILTANDNNIQAAMDTIDDHDHAAADILAALLTVDGAGSGLDADLLDGTSSAGYATSGHSHAAGDATTLDGLDSTAFAQLAVANVFSENQEVNKSNPALTLTPAANHGVIQAVVRKTGIADNTATEVFKIVVSNQAGDNEAGLYVCDVVGLVGHAGAAPTDTNNAVKKHRCSFSRARNADASLGVNTAVEDVFSGASAATTPATRDISTITVTVAESTEFDVRVSYQIDLTGSSIATANVELLITLAWSGFAVAPVITGL